jgi:hypothetical protein
VSGRIVHSDTVGTNNATIVLFTLNLAARVNHLEVLADNISLEVEGRRYDSCAIGTRGQPPD